MNTTNELPNYAFKLPMYLNILNALLHPTWDGSQLRLDSGYTTLYYVYIMFSGVYEYYE